MSVEGGEEDNPADGSPSATPLHSLNRKRSSSTETFKFSCSKTKSKMVSQKTTRTTMFCILTFQLTMVVLYALFVEYDPAADAKTPRNRLQSYVTDTYPMFQDVHVMIFIGFGFLMTFLKKYGFSSVGLTLLLAAIIIEWGILCTGFFRMTNGKILLSLTSLINGDVIAAVVLISFGAVLGKVSILQLFLMGFLETVIFSANEYLGTHTLLAIDAGGSMYVHVFGAYFGLAVSLVVFKGTKMTKKDEDLEGSSYNSDLFAMIGTVFLWLFWPSFNGALVEGDQRHRAIINTYLSLVGSCIAAFCISALVNKGNKFDMVHIQNATLAGGVCIGTAADLMVQPYGALLVGTMAGILSTVGYQYIQGYLNKILGLHDTCGVNNLHGMPGIAAGLIGALMALLAEEDTYGYNLYEIFPARTPINNTKNYETLLTHYQVDPGEGRSAAQQAAYQLFALALSFIMAVVGGIVTGFCIRNIGKVNSGHIFDDDVHWHVPDSPDVNENRDDVTSIKRASLATLSARVHP